MVKQTTILPFPEEQSSPVSWLGDYYTFNERSVLVFTPQDSGVYGLYRLDQPVFIGESANIREALLRHFTDPEFATNHHRPTCFVFEICSDNSRARRAQELIAGYRPVLQREPLDDDSRGFVSEQEIDDQGSFEKTPKNPFNVPYDSAPSKSRPAGQKQFIPSRERIIALGATLVLSIALAFHFGVFNGDNFQKTVTAGFETPGLGTPNGATVNESAPTALTSRQPALPATTKNEPREDSVNFPPESGVHDGIKGTANAVSASMVERETGTVTAELRGTAENAKRNLAAGAGTSARPAVASADGGEAVWSVQVGASAQRGLVQQEVARLKAKGYEAYTVETERDSQTWYRIRIGGFGTRAEAEALREILESREGYRRPFITSD